MSLAAEKTCVGVPAHVRGILVEWAPPPAPPEWVSCGNATMSSFTMLMAVRDNK